MLVAAVWSVLPAFATLPLLLHPVLSFTDAYFETMSGFTATGATVMTGLDELPLSMNVWRCLLTFVGGLGIIVLAVAILPMLGVGGANLSRPRHRPDERRPAHAAHRQTARGLWTVYFAVALACILPTARPAWAGPTPSCTCARP